MTKEPKPGSRETAACPDDLRAALSVLARAHTESDYLTGFVAWPMARWTRTDREYIEAWRVVRVAPGLPVKPLT